ncbi:hypothetical protein ACHQM5_010418 [Ranunculus cassubicifolius]
MATTPQEQHIETIRKTKFSIGGQQNPLTEDLHQSVKNLSAELYAKDVHFLMEIIQNAEDNEYAQGVDPSLEFIVTSRDITGTGAGSTLLVFNNEKGFSAKNIESICSVGRSTKKGQRQKGYIGEKGIGFKSVFLITAQPYIFSNGYQIKFNEEPCPHCGLGYVVPEWVEESPTLADIQKIYGASKPLPATIIVLPLKPDKEQVVKLQLSNIHPEVLLFLSKIRQLSAREDNEDTRLNTVSAISISSEIDFVTRKNVGAESYTLHLFAEEDSDENERECRYYMWRQKFPVNQADRVERRMEVDHIVMTLAFPFGKRLNRGISSPGIYAFLPTEMVTNFPFIIQADFVLASSRETILLDNKWNQGILASVPSAFVSAFISLVKTSESAPVSSLPNMFKFLPVESSSYPKLNTVRQLIKDKLLAENIMPSESHTEQKFFYKPSEVGRIMPAFWNILVKAKDQRVSMHNLSSHGMYALNSAFDREYYDDILDFLEVRSMDNEWYGKCVQSSNLVLGLSENVYLELLFFIADKWTSHFQYTNMKNIPLLKYVGQDGYLCLCSVNETAQKVICLSYDARHISWLIDWNREFRCAACLFMPKSTQDILRSFHSADALMKWLSTHAEASFIDVNEYADLLIKSLHRDRRLIVAFAHFLYHSHSTQYISQQDIKRLCKKMPLLDSYGCVNSDNNGILVPANGSKWVGLIGSNPWRGKDYVELAEDYLRAGNYAGVCTPAKKLIDFFRAQIGASDIPDLCPPNDTFPAVYSPLTKENAFLLLEWIRNLKRKGKLMEGKFLTCIQMGSWLRANIGEAVGYRPPSESFLLTPEWGNLLKNGSDLVDIPLIDQTFYGNKIIDFKDELVTIGVMCEFGEACKFIGKQLMCLAANRNLTRSNVFSILNFIKFLREKYLSPEEFIKSVREGNWMKTYHGERSPVGSILFDSEWSAAKRISSLPFIDEEYYGEEILTFRTELQLLGVVVTFDQNYQRLADCFKLPTSFTSMTADDAHLILKCIRNAKSSDKLVAVLKDKKWIRTTDGLRSPNECFLDDSKWGSLLLIFGGFPLISEKFYGTDSNSYKEEFKKLGVVVDFEDAAKVFVRQFKQSVSSSSMTKENVLSVLRCYKKLKSLNFPIPAGFRKCIRDEKWLKTRLGQRGPKEAIIFSSEWEHISRIALLPFIDDSESHYGTAIREYDEELKDLGVTFKFDSGSDFVAGGVIFPPNTRDITAASVLSLLNCIRTILKKKGSLPKEFLDRLNKSWVKTYMGYRPPSECLLFGPEWSSVLACKDATFIDEKFYGFDLLSYRDELSAIGVTVDAQNGCQLIAKKLEIHSQFDVIARIYSYLNKYDWKQEPKDASLIWIPSGNDTGNWVSHEDCVLRDNDGLFSSQLEVLEKHYDTKLLSFFHESLNVRRKPSVDDYIALWKNWESSGCQLTTAECCAFWVCMVKQLNSKTKSLLADMVKLPVYTGSDIVHLFKKQDVYIPDDLLLMDMFEKASPNPIFVWYPQPSLPSLPRTKLLEVYSNIGVRPISESVTKIDSSSSSCVHKQVDSKDMLINRELIRLVLGFLSDPSMDMDANKRQKIAKSLLDVQVFEMEEPISVGYSLSLSSGESVAVKESKMIRWERESSRMFFQKICKSSGQKAKIEYATHFSRVIAEGLLWERDDRIVELSELIKLGWLLEFDEEAIGFLLKTKNMQVFMEDVEFLKSSFSYE